MVRPFKLSNKTELEILLARYIYATILITISMLMLHDEIMTFPYIVADIAKLGSHVPSALLAGFDAETATYHRFAQCDSEHVMRVLTSPP